MEGTSVEYWTKDDDDDKNIYSYVCVCVNGFLIEINGYFEGKSERYEYMPACD
jgi:hypothetical protein